jgi:hypothetical protein
MFKFTDYINPLAFFLAFSIGIFLTYIYSKPKKVIIQWPTPENADKLVYKNNDNTCYKYKANETECPVDKTQINYYS